MQLEDSLLKLVSVSKSTIVLYYSNLDMDRVGSRMQNDVAHLVDFSRHRKVFPLED